MDARDLSPQHCDLLYQRLRPAFEYLAALQSRMEECGFQRGDRLYLEVVTARNAMQLLVSDLHRRAYRSFGTDKAEAG
jgi:hypothetical protein